MMNRGIQRRDFLLSVLAGLTLPSTLLATTQHMLLRQATDAFNKYELLSLLEPHKLSQNSLTMIRMTSALLTPIYSMHP